MALRKIKENIYNVGAIDWDRTLFDELVPLPEGTSYNAFIVKGSEKTAMIDSVEPAKQEEFVRNIKEYGLERLDYLICNHAEQDHSGLIPLVLEMFPEARLVTNEKCKGFLQDLLPIDEERFDIVKDGDILSLGDKTLEFIFAALVHWPETMFTYLREDRILFSGDFLGSHLATSETFSRDDAQTQMAAMRYYAEIMMPFRAMIQKHLKKLENYEIEMVCPVHGPVYKNPEFIMNLYREWTSDQVSNKVIIPFVSMHGSIRTVVEHLTDELSRRGIEVIQINMIESELGKLTSELVDSATVVFAGSTVLTGPHPTMVYAAAVINALRPKLKNVALLTSFGWASKCTDTMKVLLPNFKNQIFDSYDFKGHPKAEDLERIRELADQILERHQALGLL
ncbi:MAG TPA: FprA family A-type flavoprotein [Thermotogota bacterium]|nr:FprA family A-type flavoprotein [Thermotogota bacterium]